MPPKGFGAQGGGEGGGRQVAGASGRRWSAPLDRPGRRGACPLPIVFISWRVSWRGGGASVERADNTAGECVCRSLLLVLRFGKKARGSCFSFLLVHASSGSSPSLSSDTGRPSERGVSYFSSRYSSLLLRPHTQCPPERARIESPDRVKEKRRKKQTSDKQNIFIGIHARRAAVPAVMSRRP